MTVTVYIWKFRRRALIGIGNVGHASIKVDFAGAPQRSFYLSWWPGGDAAHGRGRRMLAHTQNHSLQLGYGQSAYEAARAQTEMWHATDDKGAPLHPQADVDKWMEEHGQISDKMAEGRSAEAKYKFNLNDTKVLNETRMEAAYKAIHEGRHTLSAKGHAQGGEYSLVHQNCSDAVAWLLEAGGAGSLVPKPQMRFFWTPTDVAKWCDQLVLKADQKVPGSAQRTRGFTGNDLDFTQLDWKYSALTA